MARGRRSSYTRDNRGRFASSPGGGAPKRSTPATRRAATRAGNRLNRDNSGRISGIGRNGATVRGGRIRTAKGNRRATQLASMKAAGFRGSTIAKGGRGVRGTVARSLAAVRKERGLAATREARMASGRSRVNKALESVLQRRDNAEAQRVAANGGRRTSRNAAIRRREYNSITTAVRARYAIDNPGKQRRYSTVKNPGPAGVSALTIKAPRLTAKASQPSPQARAKRPASTVRKPSGLKPGALAALPAVKPAAKKATRGPKVKLPRMATPTGVIRGSDRAKVKTDARKETGTPYSRAAQRAIDRSAREAPLQRRQAIAAAKRKGRTGFGKGPQMNAGSIGNRDYAWNRDMLPATTRERLAMWQKGERRNRGFWSGGRGVAGGYAGDLRASRRAAALVDSGDRRGNLPTTRKMAEQPRERRVDRASRNETQGRLASSEASRRLLPQIQKVRDAAQKRIAEGKKPTAAQREKERKLVGEYNKATRKLQVAQAAQSYMQNPYGFKPQRMSGAVKAAKKPTAPKRTRSSRPAGTVAKPRGMKPGVLAARRVAKAAKARGQRARLDGDAFAARFKRAKGAPLRRVINESDRENALTGAQRRAVAPDKRYAASSMRQARADRTAAAAQAFYGNYGSASMFGGRQRQSTASSPSFGSKRRGGGRRASSTAGAAPAKPKPQNKGPKGKKRWLSNDQVIQANEARGSGVRNTAEVMRSKLPKKTATALGTSTLGGYIARISGKPLSFDAANKVSDQIEKITGVGRGQLQGVRTSVDNARKTVTYSLSPVARKQAAIAEKVGSRKPRRRRSKP